MVSSRIMKINKQYDWIIAITRGGLVPSALLSHILDIKKIDTINIWSYDEKTSKEVSFINKDFNSDADDAENTRKFSFNS